MGWSLRIVYVLDGDYTLIVGNGLEQIEEPLSCSFKATFLVTMEVPEKVEIALYFVSTFVLHFCLA